MFPFCDRHNNGHVTKIQASQCLHMLGLTDVPEEIKVTKSPSLFSALTADEDRHSAAMVPLSTHE